MTSRFHARTSLSCSLSVCLQLPCREWIFHEWPLNWQPWLVRNKGAISGGTEEGRKRGKPKGRLSSSEAHGGRGEERKGGRERGRRLSGGSEVGKECGGISGVIQQREKGDREGGHSHMSLRRSARQEQSSQRTRRRRRRKSIPPLRQQEEEMKEISSGVWPGGQWTRQPLKFFHFSGNRI